MSKSILMICYYFPPLTDVGCKRSVAFAKYFKKHGWKPYVVSVKNPDKTYCALGNDSPPPGIPTEYSYSIVNIYKLFGRLHGVLFRLLGLFGIKLRRNYFYDVFCIPDHFWGWIPLTVAKARKIIKRESIDIIYVSCTPFSSAVIGLLLKRLTGRPLILDYRDPFALNYLFLRDNTPQFRQNIVRCLERLFIKNADALIVTSNEFKNLYIQEFPEVQSKIATVHNGFDLNSGTHLSGVEKYHKFTIIYTGQYFYEDEGETFFKAISLLLKNGKIRPERFQFVFYGDSAARVIQSARTFGIESLVHANQRIPYSAILGAISRSHLMLLRNRPHAIPVKLFDGIALDVPILAVMPDGEAADIIRKYSPSSYLIHNESADMVAESIMDAIVRYEMKEIRSNRVTEFLQDFSRENLTLSLMKIISGVLG